MQAVITKDLLLQSKTPDYRTDAEYFLQAKTRLQELLELTQRSGARTLVIYGDFIQRITTNQAFEVFGVVNASPVTIIWATKSIPSDAVTQSGLCLNLMAGCQVSVGMCTFTLNDESVSVNWEGGGLSLPISMIPTALATTKEEAPGALYIECIKRGRAKFPRVNLTQLDAVDDREYVLDASVAGSMPLNRVTTSEFVDKLMSHLTTRKANAERFDLRPAIINRVNTLDCDEGVGRYMMSLADQVELAQS